MKLIDFDFNAKSSSSDNELNEPNMKSLTRIRSEKLLVKLRVPKMELFHFFYIFCSKVHFSPRAMVSAKLSSISYTKSNEPTLPDP